MYAALLLATAVFLVLGMLTPFYFRGISPLLVKSAGNDTQTLQDLAQEMTQLGRVSPVFEFKRVSEAIPFDSRLLELTQNNPSYIYSGGAAPYIEEIVRRLNLDLEPNDPTSVAALLAPAEHRAYIVDFLSRSRNLNVQTIMHSRNIRGLLMFDTVNSPAGAPLDIALLTTALLIQAEEMPRSLASDIASMISRAYQGNPSDLQYLETYLISLISLVNRYQWVSLAELFRTLNSIETVNQVAALLRQYPDYTSLLYSAILLSKQPNSVFVFLQNFGINGIADIESSILNHQGGLNLLLEKQKPIYQPVAWNPQLDGLNQRLENTFLPQMAIADPVLTGIVKFLLLFSSGLSLIILIRLIANHRQGSYQSWTSSLLANIGNITIGIAFAVCAWLFLEPEFLKQQNSQTPQLTINFAAANPFDNLKSTIMNDVEIDQVTLLILSLFFIVQVAIYAYCRIKLQEIRKLDAEPNVKQRLLENEDNLFDSGLYVGLGGTVASVIMLAMHIVEASLMAAYASTLFGIIFVAILKIFHVRPYKNQLILAMQEAAPATKTQASLKLK